MIKNLIWDVDGTLFDTYPAFVRAFSAACEDLGTLVPADRIDALARITLPHCTSVLAEDLGVSVEAVLEKFGAHYAAIGYDQQPPFPGVIEVCARIQASGGVNVIITRRRAESTHALLHAHGMTGYFTDVITADDPYPLKPDPASFERMIGRHGFDKSETLGIGDRALDVLPAQATGIRACLFGAYGGDCTPDLTITDFAELLALLAAQDAAVSTDPSVRPPGMV